MRRRELLARERAGVVRKAGGLKTAATKATATSTILASKWSGSTKSVGKIERALPFRIPEKVARALVLFGSEIAACFASLVYLLFEYRMRSRWSRCAA